MKRPDGWRRPARAAMLAAGMILLAAPSRGGPVPRDPLPAARPLDDRFEQIEARAPGFGGLYRDADGRLIVRMADMREAAAAEEAVTEYLGPEEVLRSGGLRLVPADHSFSELSAWKRRASSLLSIPGVTLADVDEAANQVRIGIETEPSRGDVEEALERLGIPPGAVRIDVTGPFAFTATLQDQFRPVIGGIQIAFSCDAQGCFVCTDGFLVVKSGAKGLITNSHCTANQGGVDATIYAQPAPPFTANQIGTERRDPRFVSSKAGCPPGRICRASDSAFVKRKKQVGWTRGLVARPDAIGSLNLSAPAQTFRITSEGPAPLVGDILNKVGRTTGWTQGDVSGTCVDVSVSGTNITLLCQDIVDAGVAGGDSGSPVFRITSGTDVALYGILWGGVGSGSQFVFSRLDSIESELGQLKTCDPAAGC